MTKKYIKLAILAAAVTLAASAQAHMGGKGGMQGNQGMGGGMHGMHASQDAAQGEAPKNPCPMHQAGAHQHGMGSAMHEHRGHHREGAEGQKAPPSAKSEVKP